MDQETKSLHLELKADGDAEGAFVATFSTLNVIDHHGDVTMPGAFEPGKEVLIGGYQHDMMSLPVGKGVVRADEQRAWVEGHFFLDTDHGRATYQTVKNAGGLMEWSYIFRVLESSDGDFETDSGAVPVRFLKKIEVWSVDPVLKGAGIATRTDSIKGLPHTTFADHAEQVLASLQALKTRAKSLADLRAKEGRMFSAANVERLSHMAEVMKALAADIDEMLASMSAPPKSNQDIDADALFADLQHSLLLANA